MLTAVKFFKEQRFDFSLVAMIWILNAVTFTYKAVKHKKKAYYHNGFKCSLTSKIQKIISKTPINDKNTSAVSLQWKPTAEVLWERKCYNQRTRSRESSCASSSFRNESKPMSIPHALHSLTTVSSLGFDTPRSILPIHLSLMSHSSASFSME